MTSFIRRSDILLQKNWPQKITAEQKSWMALNGGKKDGNFRGIEKKIKVKKLKEMSLYVKYFA